jgi:fumarylpyruvate hydrolase
MRLPPFNEYLGTRVERRDDGEAVCSLELRDHHRNLRGVPHGGVVSSLLDSALGAAVISSIPREWWCATISLSVQYVAGARGDHLVAHGRVVRRGARVAFAEGHVRDGSGRLIATAHGSWHLWTHRPGERPTRAGGHVVMRDTGERFDVGKIVAVGRNYAAHVVEMGGDPDASPPVMFLKPSTALVPDGGEVEIPSGLGSVHHEVELVAVIGAPGRRIPVGRALDHVAGFAVGLDLTLRDVQAAAKKSGGPWSLAKGFDGSAPVSQVTPSDSIGDGSGLAIRLRVNGEVRQQSTTDHMIHPVGSLVSMASRLMTLQRGDLLFTGTPEGVGPVRPGDRLEAEIERIGLLTVQAVAEGDRGA